MEESTCLDLGFDENPAEWPNIPARLPSPFSSFGYAPSFGTEGGGQLPSETAATASRQNTRDFEFWPTTTVSYSQNDFDRPPWISVEYIRDCFARANQVYEPALQSHHAPSAEPKKRYNPLCEVYLCC